MKTYTFVIGSTDDFEAAEDLMDYVEQEGRGGNLNYSVHEFEAPEDCNEETVTLIGRGIAFSNDWCMGGAYSFLIHGVIGEAYLRRENFSSNENYLTVSSSD